MTGSGSPQGIRLSDRQRLNWLRLIRSENVGPVAFYDLISHFGSAADALLMVPELMRRGGSGKPARVASMDDAEREMELAHKAGAHFVGMGEPDYPPILRQCDNPPPLVAVKGDTDIFTAPPVAIVGARNASVTGMRFAQKIARELGESGHAIISGLARGIDAAAHKSSVHTGTVAVLAGGLDRPYPPENMDLYHSIPDHGGALISEMPFGWEPRAHDFPRRNRIVAGLSLGLVVIEAAEKSGSLISARLAGEMGRLVFAVPGSPLDPRAAGTNSLLKNGAILVTETDDISSAIAPLVSIPPATSGQFRAPNTSASAITPPNEHDRNALTDLLGPVPTHVDEIIVQSGLHASQVMLLLLELDLAGRLERHSGGAISLLPDV
ncbi:MAG: DNA-processing protein DprA [Phyllobacterium sp.]